MEPNSFTGRLKRLVFVSHLTLAIAIGLLLAPLDPVPKQIVAVATFGLLLGSWFYWRHYVTRHMQAVDQFAHDLAAGMDALTSGTTGQDVFTELERPFQSVAESHNRMHREVLGRQHRLQSHFDRLSTVLHSMDEGVIAVDKEERILLANAASRRMIQFLIEQTAGRPFLEASRNWALYEALHKCLTTGRVQTREIKTMQEPIRTLALRASCLPGDPPPGAVAVLHDVTELRRLENLRHEFVTNVSHELKTPLAAIMAYAETLKLGAIHDSENNVNFVSRIEEQAERLHQLIQDMLQIARVESGQEVLDIVPLSIGTAMRGSIAQHADAARRKEIELSLDFEEDAIVHADEDGLQTILDNLVSNAIKYTPVGGRVVVRLRKDALRAVVEVEDNGIGISPENQPRVFERFFRADRARSRAVISTGLGLSIVKHLAQSFGGSVGVESELGKGSTFAITFPITDRGETSS